MSHKEINYTYQILVESPDGSDPADFTTTLTQPIILDPHKKYAISLRNGLLSASWGNAPNGVAYRFDSVDYTIPAGHHTFDTISNLVKDQFKLEATEYNGKCKITLTGANTLELLTLGPLLGFTNGTIITGPSETESPSIVAVDTVSGVIVDCDIVDLNVMRSNKYVRPVIKSAVLPPCVDPYSYFDVAINTDTYYVKARSGEISSITMRVSDQNGNRLSLDPNLKTYYTLLLKEI